MTPGSIDPSMDATASYLEVSRPDFFKALRTSKLLEDEDVERLEQSSADALAIAQSLLAAGALTDFQLDAIARGRPETLRLGNYHILSRLGAGGMGTVFKARHRRMKRIVALKVLAASLSKDEAFVQRFQREVETIARLSHPNIVMAYDADEADVGHFLVMEFVDGQDLASLIEKQGTLSPAQAVDYIAQAARGLAYAHSQGIIHRDIKPHNLLLDRAGVVKIADLGLARLSQIGSPGSALTQAGGILGTVDYMPPEQALDSTAIDQRADIYSLGCTLWFLLTGKTLYAGQSVMSILLKHREAPIPSLTDQQADALPEFDPLLQRMLAKSPEARFQSMAELLSDLGALGPRVRAKGASAGAPTNYSPTARIDAARPEAPGKPSALIVEPSRVQSGILKRYLEGFGVPVIGSVATGQQALEAIRDLQPKLIVASLHLDDFTGIELARQVRASLSQAAPGFVLVSSEAEADEAGSLSQLNRVVTLRKPFSPEQLAQAANAALGASLATTPASSPASSPASPQSVWTRPDRKRWRVLLVDDSPSARRHERSVLEGLGFTQIVEAVDGAQAIATLAREPFDLIVTDYNMPLMDGLAFVTYLKQTPSTAATPVVMVTTETDEKVLGPIRALGVAAVLDKTFAPGAVGPVLERCLDSTSSGSAASKHAAAGP